MTRYPFNIGVFFFLLYLKKKTLDFIFYIFGNILHDINSNIKQTLLFAIFTSLKALLILLIMIDSNADSVFRQ